MLERRLRFLLRGGASLVVLATLACSDDKKPTTPEMPEPPEMVTRTFRGPLAQSDEECRFFTLGADGDITATITDLQPLLTLTVGLGLGVPSETDADRCSRFANDDSARVNEVFLSASNQAGTYCVCIFDVGNIFPDETITWTIDVTHPE